MCKATDIVTCLLLLAVESLPSRAADCTWEYSVQVNASVQAAPPQILLSWPQDRVTLPTSYTVYRKAPKASSWGLGIPLSGTTTTYLDKQVRVGTAYEYQIVKNTPLHTGYGYISSGIEVPMTENRGKLLLVVDIKYAVDLATELTQLEQDLAGDGWIVKRIEVNRSDSVVDVKRLIQAQYQAAPAEVRCVFLFGHVPVPYSGNIMPDGHGPAHLGAWPCDGYYGDMDGVWTDRTVNETRAADSRNRNVPGDGKFDQSTFPVPLKLMVGRVDLANMPGRAIHGGAPTFPSELELLRNYLNKDHRFRTGQLGLPRRGLVGDYFGTHNGEAFAASGWRNLASFFGEGNVTMLPNAGTWISTLRGASYLWAYGCGPGTYESIGGLGTVDRYYDATTTELVKNDVKAAFVLLYGSWLGDWDSEDDILRSVLALPSCGLACAWSGRPHWFLHSMGLGEPIGIGARLTQNNGPRGLYKNQVNTAAGQVHIALMGDPTLRLHSVAPPTNLTGATNATQLTLHWTASRDSVLGYNVYRGVPGTAFTRLTPFPITGTTFTDSCPRGPDEYMVRAVKLETSASGTYFNLSQGAFLTPADNSNCPRLSRSPGDRPSITGQPAMSTAGPG